MQGTSVLPDSVTPWTVACQAPLSLGILQAGILEWVAVPASRGSSWPRDRPRVSRLLRGQGGFLTTGAAWEGGCLTS